MADHQRVLVKSREELRRWLKENHRQKESVWLVTFKKSNPKWYLDYDSIVEELLCFGWIDSLPRLLDEHRKMLRISPRKPKSAWSKKNRERVKDLLKKGLIEPAGLAVIQLAKKTGTWGALKKTDRGEIPKDLIRAFRDFPNAKKNFLNFPPSSRKAILEWISFAKMPETRSRRVLETARLASQNIRANQYRPKINLGRKTKTF